jgi:hypothetical protein
MLSIKLSVSVGLLFVSVQSKHRNSLFRYRTETTETNCFETNRNNPKFCEKYQNMLLSHCFGCSFVCFGSIETPKLSASYRTETTETNVLFQIVPKLVSVEFRLFRIKTTLLPGTSFRQLSFYIFN